MLLRKKLSETRFSLAWQKPRYSVQSRAKATGTAASTAFGVLDSKVETVSGKLSISTMHVAKGLEFRAVLTHSGGGDDGRGWTDGAECTLLHLAFLLRGKITRFRWVVSVPGGTGKQLGVVFPIGSTQQKLIDRDVAAFEGGC